MKRHLDAMGLCDNIHELVVCSDSQSALAMVSHGFTLQYPLVVDIIKLFNGLHLDCVHLCYVPGHSNIALQECSDSLARSSLICEDASTSRQASPSPVFLHRLSSYDDSIGEKLHNLARVQPARLYCQQLETPTRTLGGHGG